MGRAEQKPEAPAEATGCRKGGESKIACALHAPNGLGFIAESLQKLGFCLGKFKTLGVC